MEKKFMDQNQCHQLLTHNLMKNLPNCNLFLKIMQISCFSHREIKVFGQKCQKM